MKCEEADLFIMKYMDGELSAGEAEALNLHLHCCESCKKEFVFYDNMLTEFSNMETLMAPEGFEAEVMAKISCITENQFTVVYKASDKVKCAVLGTFTVLFGTGSALVVYREPIMERLSESAVFGHYISRMAPVMEHVAEHSEFIRNVVNHTVLYFDTALSNAMGILMGLIAVFCAVQFYILRRKKRLNKADE